MGPSFILTSPICPKMEVVGRGMIVIGGGGSLMPCARLFAARIAAFSFRVAVGCCTSLATGGGISVDGCGVVCVFVCRNGSWLGGNLAVSCLMMFIVEPLCHELPVAWVCC
jgi:hypothetical protein